MSRDKKFTGGNWTVLSNQKVVAKGVIGAPTVADCSKAGTIIESKANAILIAQAPHLFNNLDVTTLFLQQLIEGQWSPEEIKKKAEALFYTNNLLLTKATGDGK